MLIARRKRSWLLDAILTVIVEVIVAIAVRLIFG
jgi:hypothetical protein